MEDAMPNVDQARLHLMHQYWNAANYLTVGQVYLQDNPLLKEPLRPEHIKPRLLGHWGTSPGLSFIYVHLNRLIQDEDVNMIYLAGPGQGGDTSPVSPVLDPWRGPQSRQCAHARLHPRRRRVGLCPGPRLWCRFRQSRFDRRCCGWRWGSRDRTARR